MNEETEADITEPEDTEAHAYRFKVETGEPDDTEGHVTSHKR